MVLYMQWNLFSNTCQPQESIVFLQDFNFLFSLTLKFNWTNFQFAFDLLWLGKTLLQNLT